MFKKLREKLYDKQTKKNLENMEFDTFAYYGDSAFPAFIVDGGKGDRIFSQVFVPKTENSFKMAYNKLKKYYFKKVPYIVARNNIKAYCQYFYFSEETVNYCLDVFKDKKNFTAKQEKNI